jgi:pyruvate-ferredoxin/flavodoxin oxidoreductase
VANATGCSSIYGGNLPTTPWSFNKQGRGPAWANSLFEDNAEFGLGMRLTLDKQMEFARELVTALADKLGGDLVDALLKADQKEEAGILRQRERVALLKQKLGAIKDPRAAQLLAVADCLVKKSVWIMGGDGWAYDIGFGGLDHVLASGRNVNVLVLDTEVYSNTGGQASKSTPRAAVAKFAANGKDLPNKDLGLIAMTYGYVYVAKVAMGASDQQTLRAILEADAYDGPSLVIAYSHCIQQGVDMRRGLDQQRLAVQCGFWPLYRYNPALAAEGKNPLQIDSKEPTVSFKEYAYNEVRYKMLVLNDEARAESLMKLATDDVAKRWQYYQQMAAMQFSPEPPKE